MARRIGLAPFGTLPPAAVPPTGSAEAPAPAQDLGVLRMASFGYASAVRRDGAGEAVAFPPRFLAGIELGQSAVDLLGFGGRVALTVGELGVANGDGFADEPARYGTADGREARIMAVPVSSPAATDLGTHWLDVPVVFRGVVRAVTPDRDFRARVVVGDIADRLGVPLQPSVYGGTGGQDGTEQVKGRPRPVCLGYVFNLEPVYVGSVDLGAGALPTYHVHWRAVFSIDAVRIRGVAQSRTDGAPLVGQYRDWPTLGMFQLGSAPEGDIRADVRGDAIPAYTNTVAGILERMLTSLGPQLAASDLDALAWSVAAADLGGEVGWYRGAEPTTAMAAAEEVVRGCGAVLAGGRHGLLRPFDPFAPAAPQFVVQEPWVVDLRPEAPPAQVQPLPNEVRVEYSRNWAPTSNLAGSVATADRERLASATGNPYARALSVEVTARVAQQRALTLPGLYRAAADAQARADRIAAWVSMAPRFVTVTTDRFLGQVQLGDVGRIASYPGYGLSAGLTGVVMAWRERIDERRVEITLAETTGASG